MPNNITTKLKLYLLISLMICSNTIFADKTPNKFSGIWSIKGSSKQDKWIVIHNIDSSSTNIIYHIEVLSKNKSAKLWQIEHLVPHMAITEAALSKSIKKRLQKGAVYPENYNFSYQKWLNENSNSGGFICTTSIEHCIIH